MNKRLSYAILVFISPFAAGLVGSLFTASQTASWYAGLNKPFWTPPSYVFAPVWTILYFLMAVAGVLIYRSQSEHREFALKVFFAHLAVNALWSVLFFGVHQVIAAFVAIVALWLMILVLMILFRKISSAASWLLLPYLLWVTYASTLNLGIVLLNR